MLSAGVSVSVEITVPGGRRGERSRGQTLHTSVIMNRALRSETCNLFLKRLLQAKEVHLVNYPVALDTG